MFDVVHNNKRLMQVILALIMLPFAFFGVDTYFRGMDSGNAVATFADQKISQQEFGQALRERQDALQRVLGGGRIDPAMLDNPGLRLAVLDELIDKRLLLGQALRSGLTPTDADLERLILSRPEFQQNGKFSPAAYETFLRARGMTEPQFNAQLRRELAMQQLADAFGANDFLAITSVDQLLRLNEQRREVSRARIGAERFVAQVKLDPAAAKAYYDSHQAEFQIPEQVRLDYVVLSLDGLAAAEKVTDDELKQYYDQNKSQFAVSESTRKAARARAEQLLKQARENPAGFADLARKYSQDPGSAQNGGDLGFNPRGVMVKPFDDALFQMKPGQVTGPVETQFGFHVIKLDEIRGGEKGAPEERRASHILIRNEGEAPFEEVRTRVNAELRRQKASKRFPEAAEQLNNLAYEQSDSLKPAADALHLTIQRSPWLARGAPQSGGPLGNEKLLAAAFSDEVLKDKRNTEVIEVAPSTLVAARVVEHKPGALRPFDEVSAEIVKRLTDEQAARLAAKQGAEMLAKLQRGEADLSLTWDTPRVIERQRAEGFDEATLRQAFRADASKLPAYAGIEGAGGYTLIKVGKVIDPESIAPEKRKAVAAQLEQLIGQEMLRAYLANLKRKAEVKVKLELVERKDR